MSHRIWFRTLWDTLRTGFWFVPALMAAGGAASAAVAIAVEAGTSGGAQRMPWFVLALAPDDARDLTATLLSSMVTMASLVFSITMVVLTLAASQFGPRLIRNFMGSPPTQVVLGTFIATIVHCLLTLVAVDWRQADGPLPFISVTVAIVFFLVSVALLVFHLHVLARSIMSETVIAKVGAELAEALDTLQAWRAEQPDPDAALPADFFAKAQFSRYPATGYVRAIEFEALVDAAHRADTLLGLTVRPGDFVIKNGDGIGVYPAERATPELLKAVADAVVVGVHRTPVQDPDFSIRHLVEIAVRALSPGVNDPYTATAVIDQLSASLARLFGRSLPKAVHCDDDGLIRVICPQPTYGSLIAAAFDQIRQNGAGKPFIVIHMLQAITRLAPHCREAAQKRALVEELENLLATASRSVPDAGDRDDIERHARDARQALDHLGFCGDGSYVQGRASAAT